MDADLDLLLISVYCTADDLLPERPRNARRKLTDAEVVTLCVAQVLMGIPSDRRFLRAAAPTARAPLSLAAHPGCPAQAPSTPGRDDRVAGRRVRRPLAGARATTSSCSTPRLSSAAARWRQRGARAWPRSAGYGYSRSHSRYFWGMRLHLACAPDGTPRAVALVGADRGEREVALKMLAPRPSRWRDDRLRQGLCRSRVRLDPRRLGGHRRSSRPAQRARSRRPPGAHPSARRVRLLTPAKTCSPSSATVHARPATCLHGSRLACSRSLPASASTTSSGVRAVRSSTTPRSRVAS